MRESDESFHRSNAMMVQSTSIKSRPVIRHGFISATQSLTLGAFSGIWNDFRQLRQRCWHQWLDWCDELSYALAFYQEWYRRHKF